MFTVIKRLGLVAIILLASGGYALAGPPPYCYEEQDGSPSGCFKKLKFPNGNVTDNGDGSFSIADNTSVGGGNSVYLEEGDVAKLNNSSADLTLDFNGTDFDTSVAGAELDLTIAAGVTRDTEWDTAAEINTATSDDDFATLTGSQVLTNKTLAAASNVIDADTAVALAANGADCPAGSYPLGVDASGAVESCTAATTEINSAITTHASVTATHGATGAVVGTTNTQTLTNKTLTSPTINTPSLTLSTSSSNTAGRLSRNASHYLQMGNGSAQELFYPSGTMTNLNLCTFDSTGSEIDCNTATSTFQSADADLTTYAGITPSANVQSLLGAADYAAMRGLLDLEAGTDFYSISSADSAFISSSEIDTSAELAGILTDEVGNAGGFTRGTAGATNDCVKWDASGNLVTAGAACGSGGSGDSVSIDGVAVVDPNFASAGGDIDFVDTANTVTANINWTAIGSAEIERAKLNWDTFWTDATSGINWGSVPGATTDYVLKRTASGINWQASSGGAETNSLETLTTGIATTEIPIGTAADTVVYAALSGDVTMTNGGVVSIGNDKVVEADLKAVDAASDEECLTYETTTGDFEWQSCGAGGSGATDINLPIYSAKLTGTFVTDQDATQGAQIDAGDGNWRLLFDATTDEGAVWQFVMPSNYASTPTLDIDFSMTSGEANEVEFEGAIMCYTAGTDTADVATASFSAIAVGTATTVSATAGEVYRQSITLTDDSCAAGDMVWIYLSTDADDATNDDATGDREVVGVNFNYA